MERELSMGQPHGEALHCCAHHSLLFVNEQCLETFIIVIIIKNVILIFLFLFLFSFLMMMLLVITIIELKLLHFESIQIYKINILAITNHTLRNFLLVSPGKLKAMRAGNRVPRWWTRLPQHQCEQTWSCCGSIVLYST